MKERKCIKIILALSLFPLFFFVPSVHAQALITVTPQGNVYKNVLGAEATSAQTSAQDIVGQVVNKIANIVISQVDAKVQVALNNDNGKTTNVFDSSNAPVVEVQTDVPSQKILIKKLDSGFGIQENGVTATTDFNVKIDPKSKNISLETNNGTRTLNVLPSDALQSLVRAHVIDEIQPGNFKISETDTGELVYEMSGTRTIALFNLATIHVPVSSTVSTTNGSVEKINEPVLLKVFGFLFS